MADLTQDLAGLTDWNTEKIELPETAPKCKGTQEKGQTVKDKVLAGQMSVILDIIKQNEPIITAKLIGEGITKYVGCPDKIARILRSKGLVYSKKVEGKNYVEWFIKK